MKRCKLILGVGLISFGIFKGNAQETPSAYLKKYNDEFSVKLQDHCITDIKIRKGELEITRRFLSKNVFLDKRASNYGNISLQYTPPFTEITDVEAFTLVPDLETDKYRKVKVRDIYDKEVMSDNIFYGGNRARIFSFPSLQKGSVAVLKYTEKIKEPRLVGKEIFQDHSLIEDQVWQLSFDKEVSIDFKYFNCSEDDFTHTVEERSGQVIHRWIPRNFGKLKVESEMPEYMEILPHIVYRIKSYQHDGKTIPVLRDIEDLYQWYYSIIEEVAIDQSEDLKNITDSIIQGAISDRQKTERIFKWVQEKIKYIAFENGLGGFRPRPASQVCEKRYGDCKDMSNVLVNMLRHAGIPAYHTWIGTTELPYSYSDVPSPLADNHMIASTRLDGKIVFLDATNQDLPFPMPSSFIQGKEALIGLSPDSFLIMTIPEVPSEKTIIWDSAFVQLDGLELKGVGKRNYRGYYADMINGNLNNNDKKELNDLLKYHVRKGNNNCNSYGYKVDRQNAATIVDYNFNIPGYAYRDNDKIFLNLNLEKAMDSEKIEDDREHPVKYRFAYKLISKFVLAIPEGYRVTHIPETDQTQFDKFTYTLGYHLDENRLEYLLEINVNTLTIGNDDFANWNKLIQDLNRSYSETIMLEKI